MPKKPSKVKVPLPRAPPSTHSSRILAKTLHQRRVCQVAYIYSLACSYSSCSTGGKSGGDRRRTRRAHTQTQPVYSSASPRRSSLSRPALFAASAARSLSLYIKSLCYECCPISTGYILTYIYIEYIYRARARVFDNNM